MTTHPEALSRPESRPLEGNAPLLLDGPAWCWRIESGTADVFAVPLDNGVPLGTRHHVARFNAGDILFACAPGAGSSPIGLLAVGLVGTRVRALRTDRLGSYARDESFDPVGALETWITSVSASASPVPMTTDRTLATETTEAIPAGQSARPADGVAWIRVVTGCVQLFGNDVLQASPLLVPLAESTAIRAQGDASIEVLTTADALQAGMEPGLERFHLILLHRLAAQIREEDGAERARLERLHAFNTASRHHALSRLAGVFNERDGASEHTPAFDSDANPFLATFRIVTRHLGMPFRPPERVDATDETAPIERIAHASRLRIRRIALEGAWWGSDGPAMIGFRATDARPVALLPGRRGRYRLVDPLDASEHILTSELAAGLSADAWHIYRSFPDRPLNGRDILWFGLAGTRQDLVRLILMGFGAGLLALLPPIATGVVFGRLIPESASTRIVQLSIALVLAGLAIALFQIVRGIAISRIEARIDASIQPAVWDRLLRLPTGFFRAYSAGDLAARAMGLDTARQILTGTAINAILGSFFSVFSFGLLFYYDVELAIVATFFVIVALIVTVATTLHQLRTQRMMTALQSSISGMVLQVLTGIAKLRVAGAEDRAFARWADMFARQKRESFRTQSTANAFAIFGITWPVIGTVTIFWYVARAEVPPISTANLLAFLVAYLQFLTATLATGGAISAVLQAVPLFEQARPIIQTLPEVRSDQRAPGPLSGAIEISHVSFRYTPESPLALKDISVRIGAGEFVAFVGPSGAGKSSLLRLILGFDSPESGSIFFDGMDLAVLDAEAVRRQMGVVTQDSRVLPGSIQDNIIGASLLTLDDAWEAARLAGLDEDIRQMPMGMQTMISEGGATFSGGQLQRLMIARAIVRKPRILLFDEATSALDNRTQAIVSESLDQLQATRIVIAHRLSTIIHADCVHVIERGRLVQSGTYADLIAQPGPFATLAKRQLS